MGDPYYSRYYLPTMEKELASRQGQFQANLGRRAASTMGMLTAQKQAQNDAIFRAGLPRQYQQEQLKYLGDIGQSVLQAQKVRFDPYQALQGLYAQGGSAQTYDNAMRRQIDYDIGMAQSRAQTISGIASGIGQFGGLAAKAATGGATP